MDTVLSDTSPGSANYYSAGSSGMLGNDRYGDCVFAADGHAVQQQTFFGQGAMTTVDTSQVLAGYSAVTGFSAGPPVVNDNGAMIADGLGYLLKTGMSGVRIAAYGSVDPAAIGKVKTAVAQFGAVSIGFNFPSSAMSQFNAGMPWDVVANDGGIDGGHCVLVTGYDSTYLYVFTWGAVQKMTYSFWAKYVDEAWPLVSQSWVNTASGLDPEGVDIAALGAQYTAVTGQPSPFPAVVPPPPPPPPVPADADHAFAAVAAPWARQTRTRPDLVELQHAIRVWLVAKSL